MKMAFIGDSLVSCTNETLANTWYDIASKKMGFDVVNNAAGGKLTLVMWGMFKMDVVDEKADGVFLCCGMNDILLDEPMSSIQENISGTLDKARDAKLPIVILGIPPLTRIESTKRVAAAQRIRKAQCRTPGIPPVAPGRGGPPEPAGAGL